NRHQKHAYNPFQTTWQTEQMEPFQEAFIFSTEIKCGTEEQQRLTSLEQKIHSAIAGLFQEARVLKA
ncbi:MAG: hypothetical protein IJL80_06020, partial [Treponema sp.]|nr:hypothetical protein [Treponema sp.]